MNELLEAALQYVDLGWPVLPLHAPSSGGNCSCGRSDCTSAGKHPRLQHGSLEASTDAKEVGGWWSRWPGANVGLRTGVRFDALDVDGEEGEATMLAACAEHGQLPDGPWSLTGGGGHHFLFLPTGSRNRAGILPKVDWRGEGGYIVVPPSLHVSGKRYKWQEGPGAPLHLPPAWLASLVSPPVVAERPTQPVRFLPPGSGDGTPYGLRALEAELAELARAAIGTRNDVLNACGFNLYQLAAGGELSEAVVTDRLRSTATSIGLGASEITDTLGSAYRGGTASPRSAPELKMVVGGSPAVAPAVATAAQVDATPEPDQDIDTFLNEDEPDYVWVIPGLIEKGDRIILTGAEGSGKALATDTAIPWRSGWTTMGDLVPGDEVFSADGSLTQVVAVTDIMENRPCYRVTFSDGSAIVADAGHLWETETLMSREASAKAARRGPTRPRGTDQRSKRLHFPSLVTTEAMASTISARNGHALNHSVRTCEPLDLKPADLLVDPYILGAWLGDGHSAGARLTCDDPQIILHIRDKGQRCWKGSGEFGWGLSGTSKGGGRPLQVRLRTIGVLNDKHIPTAYLRSSIAQRLELLQGLMDTDGTVSPSGVCEFSVCNPRLARDVHELLIGLGIKVAMRQGPAKIGGRVVGVRYRLGFQTRLPVFFLSRKARQLLPVRTARPFLRYVVSVDPVEPVPVRCIQVEHPSGMFLAGENCIPTHNSTLLRQFCVMAGAGIHPFTLEDMPPVRVMYVDLENSRRQVRRKMRPLRLVAKDLDPLMIRVRIVTEGIDLLRPSDVACLEERIVANRPGLIVMGPLYKLVGDDPTKEEPARVASMVLDRLRATYEFALLMEAHVPHAGNGAKRPERPYGASLWMRWPEFGLFLDGESGALRHWRGARDERDWPTLMQRGGAWPWTPVTDTKAVTFARVMEECRKAGRKLSERELARVTGANSTQIHRAIDANRNQFDALIRDLDQGDF